MISAGERPQTYALDEAATGTGNSTILVCSYCGKYSKRYKIITALTTKSVIFCDMTTYQTFLLPPSSG
jgi:hypothetical protein